MSGNKSWLTGVIASGVASTAILGGALISGGEIPSSQAADKATTKAANAVEGNRPITSQVDNKAAENTVKKIRENNSHDNTSRSQTRKAVKQVKTYLVVRGQGTTYMVNEGATVSDLLKSAHVTLGDNDELNVNENSIIKNNSVVTINKITKKSYDKNVSTPYETVSKIATSNCSAGVVANTPGKNGSTLEHWVKTFTNGNLTGDDKISSTIKSKPVDSINTICSLSQSSDSTSNDSTAATDATSSDSETIEAPKVNVSGSNIDWMKAAGISEDNYQYVNYIVYHESGWDYNAVNASSGAFGLCQALPAGKLASAGADWKTNPVTQLKWCNNYANERYGNWANAYKAWTIKHWW